MRRAICSLSLAILLACGEAADSDAARATSDSLTVLLTRARDAYGEGEHASALSLYGEALKSAVQSGAVEEEVEALTWLGLAAYRLGDHRQARERLHEAIERADAYQLHELKPRAYNALGLLAVAQSRLAEAAEYYEETLAAAQMVGDVEYRAKAGMNLGLVYTQFGDFDEARRAFQDGVTGGRELGIPALEIRSLVNLAMLETRTGNPDRALDWLHQVALLDLASDPVGEEAYWGQLVSAHLAMGTVQPALVALDSALRLSTEQGLREPQAANLSLMGEIHARLGDHRRAIHVYERALEIQTELGLEDERAETLRFLAEIHAARRNLRLARSYAERALAIHQAIGAPFAELDDQISLAELAQREGKDEAAEQHLAAAQALARALDVRRSRVGVALAEAKVADLSGQNDRVIKVIAAVGPELAVGDFDAQWQAHALEARAHARMGDLERAIRSGRAAVDLIEHARRGVGSKLWEATFVAERNAAYVGLVESLLEVGRAAEAFDVADGVRGGMWFAVRDDAARSQAAGDTERRVELLHEIDALVVAIGDAAREEDRDAVRELSDRLERARRDYEIEIVQSAGRRLSADSGGPKMATRDARALLDSSEAILEFLPGQDVLITFLVTRDSVRAFRATTPTRDLLSRVRLAHELLAAPGGEADDIRPVLEQLWTTLIGPVKAAGGLAGVRHIITVPHGVLTYVPYAALLDPSTRRYLAESYTISYIPSAVSLAAARSAGSRGTPEGVAAFAPLPGELPASLDEVEAIGSVYHDAAVRSGRAASERVLRTELIQGSIVHVASHAVLNVSNPLFSRIALARLGPEPDDDGRLEVHEVLELEVRSPLVFLSGCETGAGASWTTSFSAGEDFATLALAFLSSGAANVIATLWPIEDVSAARFARRFYEGLREVGPAEALVAAQRDMLQDEKYSHPHYWAGYRLAGAGDQGWKAQKVRRLSVSS